MIQQNFSLYLVIIYLVLALMGVGYNALVAQWERKHYIEGYTALAVALGVSITLVPFWFFPAVPIWQVYLAFICTGAPMMIGSIFRHVAARSDDQKDLRNE
jgi:peptidoglycan/LPS O-acetylase OafA/YrhL